MTLAGWLAGFAGILFIRFLLENISSTTATGIIGSDVSTLLHYYLFYLAVALSLILVLNLFLPGKLAAISKAVLFALIITWLPPIIDLVLSGGAGYGMAYLFLEPAELSAAFLTFFGDVIIPGITPGIRVEIFLILIAVLLYVSHHTKSFIKALGAAVVSYVALFFWLGLPSFISVVFNSLGSDIMDFFTNAALWSILVENAWHAGMEAVAFDRVIELLFNYSISHVLFLAIILLVVVWLYRFDRKMLVAHLLNSRLKRVAYYFSLIVIGGLLGGSYADPEMVWTYLDITSVLITAISFYAAWMFAEGVNDLEDVDIDEVSNKNRPLIAGALTREDMRSANIAFFLAALIGGFLVGHYILFFILSFTAAYYIYSARPLKLKRLPMVAPFLVAIAGLSAVMAGFFLIGVDQTMDAFPVRWVALILLGLTMAVNVKDVKDYAGDKTAGVKTLPVIYGEKRGKQIVGALLGLAFLLIPVFLSFSALWIPSIVAAVVSYLIVNLKPYNERHVFGLFFLYLVASLIILA